MHQTKPFYNDLCEYLSSGTIVVMILENAVKVKQRFMGATDPNKAEEWNHKKIIWKIYR